MAITDDNYTRKDSIDVSISEEWITDVLDQEEQNRCNSEQTLEAFLDKAWSELTDEFTSPLAGASGRLGVLVNVGSHENGDNIKVALNGVRNTDMERKDVERRVSARIIQLRGRKTEWIRPE